jgi:hypothetical protein
LRAKGAVELHHGEAEVADELAGNMARARGWRIVGHPSSMHEHRCEVDERVEARPPLIRDHDIVDETECLVAMPWRSEYLRNGEWATIRYARKVGKPITIIWPDGTIS